MSKQKKTLIILGMATALVPFVGVPYAWRQWVLFIVGVCIVLVTLSTLKKIRSSETPKRNDISET